MSLKQLAQRLLLSALVLGASASGRTQEIKPQGVPAPSPTPPVVSQSPSSWKEFSPPEGGFKILMPGTPALTTREVELNQGYIVKFHLYQLSYETAFYMVMYADLPVRPEQTELIKKLLDNSGNSMRAEDKGNKLISEIEITVDGAPGRERLVQRDGFIIKNRTLIAKGRLYDISFGTLQNLALKTEQPSPSPQDLTALYEATANKFFDSFKTIPNLYLESGEVDRLLLKEKGVVIGACAPSTDCKPVTGDHTVTGGPLNDKATSLPPPAYPAIAKAARASGPVSVKVLIDEEGKVIAAQAVSGHPLLQFAAVKAAREARFSPTLLNGKPVKVVGVLVYNFLPR